jgi:pimeloyl-ACP methyl ester carboxylesterase
MNMNGPERAAAAESAAAAVGRVNQAVAEVSTAIRSNVRRHLKVLGPAGTLPMDAVDAHHDGVHRVIGWSATVVGRVAGAGLDARTAADVGSIHDDPTATVKVAGARAAFGDVLPPPLNPPMMLIDTEIGPSGPTPALAVFVHGLGGHERQWGPSYLDTLSSHGFTCLVVRYSTGLPIRANGAELARVLVEHLDRADEPTTRLVLIGHSMGGLVITEALATDLGKARLVGLVTDVVTLGTPFQGAPLERFARSVLAAGSKSAVAAPILALGDHRSAGIKDLGDGITVGLPAGIRHHAVVAHLGGAPGSLKSTLLGDGMVRPTSAMGVAPHPELFVHHLPESGHLHLLDHPGVTELLSQEIPPNR